MEAGDHERAAAIAGSLNPRAHPNRSRQAAYWMDYGRALTRLRGRHDDAVLALRHSEMLDALNMQRNPFVRDVLGELLCAHGGMRWAGNCGGWPTALGCRGKPIQRTLSSSWPVVAVYPFGLMVAVIYGSCLSHSTHVASGVGASGGADLPAGSALRTPY